MMDSKEENKKIFKIIKKIYKRKKTGYTHNIIRTFDDSELTYKELYDIKLYDDDVNFIVRMDYNKSSDLEPTYVVNITNVEKNEIDEKYHDIIGKIQGLIAKVKVEKIPYMANPEDIKKFEEIWPVNASNEQEVIQKIYHYYEKLSQPHVGDVYEIDEFIQINKTL